MLRILLVIGALLACVFDAEASPSGDLPCEARCGVLSSPARYQPEGHYGVKHQRRAEPRRASSRRVSHARAARGGHQLVASTGARASVSTAALPRFRCLVAGLERAGYRIDFMGGYASRGNSSAHPTGNALDINQTGRSRVTRPLPASASAIAHGCGLVHGAEWRHADAGHFEMPRRYGYVRIVRYARRW